jgi:hypothetical protein
LTSARSSTVSEVTGTLRLALVLDVAGSPCLALVLDVAGSPASSAAFTPRCLLLHSIAAFALMIAVLDPSRLRLRSPLWPASVRDDEIDLGSALGFLC